jgi:rhamnogalacturonyl hydrolase YesR
VGPSATYTKTANGIFWHKLTGGYNNVSMLDGMYMAHPFLAKYGSMFGDAAAIDTAVNQALFMYNQLYDNTIHLIRHAWTSTPASYASWANAGTGNSPEVWSRAMGWYVMALVDILKYVPAAHPKRAQLLTALSNLAIGIKNYQDATTGLWYQVVDKGIGHAGYTAANYIETSGSSMFIYALKTASDSGWISSATYLPVAQAGWTGLKAMVDTYTDSKPRINNFAPAMSVQGSYAAYVGFASVDAPTTTNPHGYAAILDAASVMEFPLSTLPVKFISFTAKQYPNKITLTWESGDDNEADHYDVQKSINGNDFTTIGTVKSTGISHYSFDDNNVENRTIYYRIKAVSIDGSPLYSPILAIHPKNTGNSLQVYPNPARDGNINILLSGLDNGTYNLQIFNTAGMVISKRAISVNDETSTVISLSLATASAGIYHVLLEGNSMRITESLVIR